MSSKMSNSKAKVIGVGSVLLMALIATIPTGGAMWGSVLAIGSFSLDPLVWGTAAIGSIGILFSKKNGNKNTTNNQ